MILRQFRRERLIRAYNTRLVSSSNSHINLTTVLNDVEWLSSLKQRQTGWVRPQNKRLEINQTKHQFYFYDNRKISEIQSQKKFKRTLIYFNKCLCFKATRRFVSFSTVNRCLSKLWIFNSSRRVVVAQPHVSRMLKLMATDCVAPRLRGWGAECLNHNQHFKVSSFNKSWMD